MVNRIGNEDDKLIHDHVEMGSQLYYRVYATRHEPILRLEECQYISILQAAWTMQSRFTANLV